MTRPSEWVGGGLWYHTSKRAARSTFLCEARLKFLFNKSQLNILFYSACWLRTDFDLEIKSSHTILESPSEKQIDIYFGLDDFERRAKICDRHLCVMYGSVANVSPGIAHLGNYSLGIIYRLPSWLSNPMNGFCLGLHKVYHLLEGTRSFYYKRSERRVRLQAKRISPHLIPDSCARQLPTFSNPQENIVKGFVCIYQPEQS